MKKSVDCWFPQNYNNQNDYWRANFRFHTSSKTNLAQVHDLDYPGELYEKDFEQFDIFWKEKGYFDISQPQDGIFKGQLLKKLTASLRNNHPFSLIYR